MHRIHRLKLGRGWLVVSLIMPHIGYGGVMYAGADACWSLLTVHSFSEEA
jgi:hypothetical protein